MKQKAILLLVLGALFTFTKTHSQMKSSPSSKPTIVLVHGLWADGSCWNKVMAPLLEKGYNVIAVQNPTTSIEEDVAATQRAIERAGGDVILVGHSWGGFVISEAGSNPKVKALVYVAAYMPDKGETIPSLSEKAPATKITTYLQPVGGYLTLSKEGIQQAFANDLPVKEQNLVFSVQQPASPKVFEAVGNNTAWKQKPTWYIVASEDNTISPELEKIMAARAQSKTTILKGSHVVMLSKPKEALAVILEAATHVNKDAATKMTQYEIKHPYHEQFRKVLRDYVHHSVNMESNIMSEAYYERDNPNLLWLIERWESRDELNKSNAGIYFKTIETLSKEALVQPSRLFYMEDLAPLSKHQWKTAPKKQDSPLTVMLFVDAKPGTQEAFKDIYHAALPQFRSEPGVITYQLSQLKDDDTQFVTYEKFRNDEAFQYHLKFPPIQPVLDYLETSIKKPPFQSGLHHLIEFAPLIRE